MNKFNYSFLEEQEVDPIQMATVDARAALGRLSYAYQNLVVDLMRANDWDGAKKALNNAQKSQEASDLLKEPVSSNG